MRCLKSSMWRIMIPCILHGDTGSNHSSAASSSFSSWFLILDPFRVLKKQEAKHFSFFIHHRFGWTYDTYSKISLRKEG